MPEGFLLKLKKAYIEITNICNHHCSFCHGSNREKQNMKVDQFWHIAKKIRPYVDSIYLHVLGEPLCHPQLKEILDIANELRDGKKGISGIGSNGKLKVQLQKKN